MKLFKTHGFSAMVLTAALANLAVPASAGDVYAARKAVPVADLNLAVPADAKEMVRRIGEAARKVCRQGNSPAYINSARFYRHCVKDAIESSVRQVNDQRLTDAYRGSSERHVAS
jgi:UrcA family protein